MNLLRETVRTMKAMLDSIPDRIDHWLLSLHKPEDIDGEAVCLRCRESWPCAEWMEIDERIAERTEVTR